MLAVSVRIEKSGPVTTVILDRPGVKNAVDRPTAEALADAFRAFDADPEARVGVLYGDHGTFCAGADLKAIARGEGNVVLPDGDGPMGPTRMLLLRSRSSRPSRATRWRAGWSWLSGATCAWWRRPPRSASSAAAGACRSSTAAPCALPRLVGLSRALDLILTPGARVGAAEALALGLANRVVPEGTAARRRRRWRTSWRCCRRSCLRGPWLSAYRSSSGCRWTRRSPTSSRTGWCRSRRARWRGAAVRGEEALAATLP